jgi:hypothetical protein
MAELTQDNLKSFIVAYDKAIEEDLKYFTFEGEQVLVTYATYLLQYINENLKTKIKQHGS